MLIFLLKKMQFSLSRPLIFMFYVFYLQSMLWFYDMRQNSLAGKCISINMNWLIFLCTSSHTVERLNHKSNSPTDEQGL